MGPKIFTSSKPKNPKQRIKSKSTNEKNSVPHLLTNKWRILICLNTFSAILTLACVTITFLTKQKIQKYLQYVEEYDQGALLTVIAVLGLLIFMIFIIGAVISYYSTIQSYRSKLKNMVYKYLFWICGSVLMLLVIIIIVYYHAISLRNIFKNGFFKIMSAYLKDRSVKNSIDILQNDWKCCGNIFPSEWNNVVWRTKNTSYLYPESCCSDSTHPCNIHKSGCVRTIVKIYSCVLFGELAALLALSALTFCVALLTFDAVKAQRKFEQADLDDDAVVALDDLENTNASATPFLSSAPTGQSVGELRVGGGEREINGSRVTRDDRDADGNWEGEADEDTNASKYLYRKPTKFNFPEFEIPYL